MSYKSPKEQETSRTNNWPLGNPKNDARDTISDFYSSTRSSHISGNGTSRTNRIRTSLFKAFAYEDFPDLKLQSASTTTITKAPASATTVDSPPRRPPRPDSWVKNDSKNPWADVSLNGMASEKRSELDGSHQRSRSAAPSSYIRSSGSNISNATESVVSDSNSLEKLQSGPPRPVGFWHSSLKKERRQVLGRWALMTLVLSIFILGILSLYWAVVLTVDEKMDSLKVYVVNFETESDALVGPIVTGVTEGIVRENAGPHLGYTTVLPAMFNGDTMAVREAVWEEQAWAAIVVNSNASTLLRQAIKMGNSSYDPNGAIQIIYNEAREQDLYFDHIYPMMQMVQTQILQKFGEKWTAELMSTHTITKANMGFVTQAVNPGIGFSIYNLRPFLPHTAIPAVSIGLIYLIIISFFSFSFYLPIHMRLLKGPGHAPIRFWQFILWRWCATVMAYFILSLAYSLVSLAFQFPFGNAPGSHFVTELTPSKFYNATFVVYWMINFLGMIALGLACENMAMFLGMPWTALWLIFWVITNVATAFYSIQLESGFYAWGYVWPLHNIVEASRTTLFDLHSNLGMNFGVLAGWGALNTVIFPFACLYMKWKMAKVMRRQQQR